MQDSITASYINTHFTTLPDFDIMTNRVVSLDYKLLLLYNDGIGPNAVRNVGSRRRKHFDYSLLTKLLAFCLDKKLEAIWS